MQNRFYLRNLARGRIRRDAPRAFRAAGLDTDVNWESSEKAGDAMGFSFAPIAADESSRALMLHGVMLRVGMARKDGGEREIGTKEA